MRKGCLTGMFGRRKRQLGAHAAAIGYVHPSSTQDRPGKFEQLESAGSSVLTATVTPSADSSRQKSLTAQSTSAVSGLESLDMANDTDDNERAEAGGADQQQATSLGGAGDSADTRTCVISAEGESSDVCRLPIPEVEQLVVLDDLPSWPIDGEQQAAQESDVPSRASEGVADNQSAILCARGSGNLSDVGIDDGAASPSRGNSVDPHGQQNGRERKGRRKSSQRGSLHKFLKYGKWRNGHGAEGDPNDSANASVEDTAHQGDDAQHASSAQDSAVGNDSADGFMSDPEQQPRFQLRATGRVKKSPSFPAMLLPRLRMFRNSKPYTAGESDEDENALIPSARQVSTSSAPEIGSEAGKPAHNGTRSKSGFICFGWGQPEKLDDDEEEEIVQENGLDDGHVPPGLVGLVNLGNTCFLNAALQCLRCTPGLAEMLAPELREGFLGTLETAFSIQTLGGSPRLLQATRSFSFPCFPVSGGNPRAFAIQGSQITDFGGRGLDNGDGVSDDMSTCCRSASLPGVVGHFAYGERGLVGGSAPRLCRGPGLFQPVKSFDDLHAVSSQTAHKAVSPFELQTHEFGASDRNSGVKAGMANGDSKESKESILEAPLVCRSVEDGVEADSLSVTGPKEVTSNLEIESAVEIVDVKVSEEFESLGVENGVVENGDHTLADLNGDGDGGQSALEVCIEPDKPSGRETCDSAASDLHTVETTATLSDVVTKTSTVDGFEDRKGQTPKRVGCQDDSAYECTSESATDEGLATDHQHGEMLSGIIPGKGPSPQLRQPPNPTSTSDPKEHQPSVQGAVDEVEESDCGRPGIIPKSPKCSEPGQVNSEKSSNIQQGESSESVGSSASQTKSVSDNKVGEIEEVEPSKEGKATAPVEEEDDSVNFITALRKTLVAMCTKAPNTFYNPRGLYRQLGKLPQGEWFCDGGQHDCQEVIKVLLDSVHNELNCAEVKAPGPGEGSADDEGSEAAEDTDDKDEHQVEARKADDLWCKYLECDCSPITDLFAGQLQIVRSCQKCSTKTTTYEPFWELSLPLVKETRWFIGGRVPSSIQDLLKAFTSEEAMQGDDAPYCEKCDQKCNATRRIKIHRFPEMLVLNVKRFKYTKEGREKLTPNIAFPIKGLKLQDYASKASKMRNTAVTYNLYAVSNHFGSLGGGHYTAYCKAKDPKGKDGWFCFNDQAVTKIKEDAIVSPNAYVLFYARAKSRSQSR